MKFNYFGKDIEPSCEYCAFCVTSEEAMQSCLKKRKALPGGGCGGFEYAPTKRKPKVKLTLPQYSAEDFKL